MFFLLIAANLAVYLSSLQFLGSGRLALGGDLPLPVEW